MSPTSLQMQLSLSRMVMMPMKPCCLFSFHLPWLTLLCAPTMPQYVWGCLWIYSPGDSVGLTAISLLTLRCVSIIPGWNGARVSVLGGNAYHAVGVKEGPAKKQLCHTGCCCNHSTDGIAVLWVFLGGVPPCFQGQNVASDAEFNPMLHVQISEPWYFWEEKRQNMLATVRLHIRKGQAEAFHVYFNHSQPLIAIQPLILFCLLSQEKIPICESNENASFVECELGNPMKRGAQVKNRQTHIHTHTHIQYRNTCIHTPVHAYKYRTFYSFPYLWILPPGFSFQSLFYLVLSTSGITLETTQLEVELKLSTWVMPTLLWIISFIVNPSTLQDHV